jgi:hypothetical protein
MELLKMKTQGEWALFALFIIYVLLGLRMPETVATLIDSLFGRIALFGAVVYLFLYSNPILAVLAVYVAYDLIQRSSVTTGIDALKQYAPSEEKKSSQFSAFNQFPYTLEQEMVAKMAPMVRSGFSLNQATFKPMLETNINMSPV